MPLTAAVIAALLVGAAAAMAQVARSAEGDAAVSFPAELREGTCVALGDPVAVLAPVPISGGSVEATAATSETTAPIAFDELTGRDHALVVEGGAPGGGQACATLRGPIVDDVGLAAALRAQDDGEVAGVVWARTVGETATSIRVFVTIAIPAIEPVVEPVESPAPQPGDGPDVPDAEIDPRDDIEVDVGR